MRFASSAAHQQGKIARLTRERDAALEQQTATSEVLHVNSTSRGELEPVFQIMPERAVRICEAKFGALYRFDGNALHLAAQLGASRELAELRSRRGPFQPTPGGLLDLVLRTKRVNYVADQTAGPSGQRPPHLLMTYEFIQLLHHQRPTARLTSSSSLNNW